MNIDIVNSTLFYFKQLDITTPDDIFMNIDLIE